MFKKEMKKRFPNPTCTAQISIAEIKASNIIIFDLKRCVKIFYLFLRYQQKQKKKKKRIYLPIHKSMPPTDS